MGTLSNIKVQPHTVSWNAVDLGYTDGDLEIVVDNSNLIDVTAHQEGSTVLDQIKTGDAVKEISVVLKEVSSANLALIKNGLGGSYTPGGGTEVIGVGGVNNFEGILQFAQKLIFHPVGVTGVLQDWAAWKAVPVVTSLTSSGENINTLAITFKCFPDTTKKAGLQVLVFGDHTQVLTA